MGVESDVLVRDWKRLSNGSCLTIFNIEVYSA